MDALQFSLFFVALLVGYVLVHLRLVRFEEHLQKLAGIRGLDDRLRALDDRLRGLVETLDKFRLDRVEGQLERLHDDLEDLRETTSMVRQAVVEIPPPPVPTVAAAPTVVEVPVVAPAPVESAGHRVLALVETRLVQLGYRGIRVLTDLSTAQLEQVQDVQVECELGGMPVKGRVVVHNGAVREVVLQTVAAMFP